MSSKTYYDILGAPQTATAERIREEYLVRCKMFHPDRFDQSLQQTEWRLANEMLKELNQAYSVLGNPSSRLAYDLSLRRSKPPPIPPAAPPTPPTQGQKARSVPGHEALTSGYARFSELPQTSQDKLFQRVAKTTSQQYITSLRGVGWNYFFLIFFLCWFVLIFIIALDERWTSDGRYWIWGTSAVSALFVGTNLSWIIRWHKSPLRCHFIVSPLYFIKTHLDQVWFWPLWHLKNLGATHNYHNGSFTGTDVRFVFDTGPENLSFPQRGAYEQVVSATKAFNAKLQSVKLNGEHEYLSAEDDFRGWRSGAQSRPPRSPSLFTIVSVTSSFGIAALLTLTAAQMNINAFPYKPPSRFSAAQAVAPISQPTHPEFIEPELVTPLSGEVRSYSTRNGVAPLQIRSSSGADYLVKLDDATSGWPVLTVFVRGGQTEEIKVPLGTYVVKYASGDRWYGYTHLFGPDTQYSKADKTFTFSFDGSQYSGYTVTLYKVRDGNLSTSRLAPDDF